MDGDGWICKKGDRESNERQKQGGFLTNSCGLLRIVANWVLAATVNKSKVQV
jgi:hypothetical protein